MNISKEELRNEFSRLISNKTEEDSLDEYHKFLDTALELSLFFKGYKFKNQADGDSTILFQMVIGKALSILKLLNGVSYTSNSNIKIQFANFIDPFSIWPLVRTQFEAFCNFNNIYVNHTEATTELLYNLWVLSGLMYRQSFTEIASTEENINKAEKEKKHIEKIKQIFIIQLCIKH
ncbi:MAG: hypothetical protein ACXWEY_02215 [Bacteroidia bacterium]